MEQLGLMKNQNRKGNGLSLYWKECKKVLRSLTFLLYTAAIVFMYYTQFSGELKFPEAMPEPGLANYGTVAREEPEVLVPKAIDSLIIEYLQNSYQAYPLGFVKYIHLLEKKQQQIADIIEEVSGITKEQMDNYMDFIRGEMVIGENNEVIYKEPQIPQVSIPETLTYERFRELMREADQIIGGGSQYSDEFIVENFSRVPKTYEEALAEYNQFINKDKVTRAYARLYCDYIGVVLAILPVFVAVSLTVMDRRARMEQLIRAKQVSSAKIVFTRYAALVTVMFLPVVVTAFAAQAEIIKLYPGKTLDLFAFPKYTIGWLIPAIMISAAVGVLVSEMFSILPAIFIQGVWWFGSIFTGSLTGKIGKFTLVVRHNSLYKADLFYENFGNLVFNRIFFTAVSLAAVALAALIYEQKRRGYGDEIQIFHKIGRHKSKA